MRLPGRRPAVDQASTAKARTRAPWWELPVLIVSAVLVAILVKTFLVQPFYIPSASMERTLHGCDTCSGDRILVAKPVYTVLRDPHPGDIVVFRDPGGWDPDPLPAASGNPVVRGLSWFGRLIGVVPPREHDLVKRVIAIGGQTVKCCDTQGNVQVGDGGAKGAFRSLDDASYVLEDGTSAALGQIPFGPVTVPSGRLWVMGDHRNDSADSRYHCPTPPEGVGVAVCTDGSAATARDATVPVDDVLGKAVLIAWPVSRWTTLGTPKTLAALPLPAAAGGLQLPAPAVTAVLLALAGLTAYRRRRR